MLLGAVCLQGYQLTGETHFAFIINFCKILSRTLFVLPLLLFETEDGSCTFLRNFGETVPDYILYDSALQKQAHIEANSCSSCQEILSILWTRDFITMFTTLCQCLLPWASWIQSITPSRTILLISVLILSLNLRLSFPSDSFPSGLPTRILYVFFYHACCMLWPSHPSWFYSFNTVNFRFLRNSLRYPLDTRLRGPLQAGLQAVEKGKCPCLESNPNSSGAQPAV
jgi:hypothetical protein